MIIPVGIIVNKTNCIPLLKILIGYVLVSITMDVASDVKLVLLPIKKVKLDSIVTNDVIIIPPSIISIINNNILKKLKLIILNSTTPYNKSPIEEIDVDDVKVYNNTFFGCTI